MLDNIVKKCNSTVLKTIKVRPIDVPDNSFAEYNEDFNKKNLDLKLVIMLEFLSIKIFLLEEILLIGQMKFLLLIKLKTQFHGLIVLVT